MGVAGALLLSLHDSNVRQRELFFFFKSRVQSPVSCQNSLESQWFEELTIIVKDEEGLHDLGKVINAR